MRTHHRCAGVSGVVRSITLCLVIATCAGTALRGGPALAQDMEPRSYANTPIHLNMLGLGYVYSWGTVLVSSSLPVEDLDANLNTVTPLYVRTLPLLGWASKIVVAWPYVNASGEGSVEGQPVSGTRKGWADPRMRLNVNFIGAPALRLRDFPTYRQKTIVGATFEVQAPLGTYDSTKPINIGANRWTFMAEAGISERIRRWTFEASAGVIYFTENDEYLGTNTLTQDPVLYTDVHVIFAFKPVVWLAYDGLFVWGGQTDLNGVERDDLQTNTRTGFTFSFPIARHHRLKLVYTSGVTTRYGADFQSLGISWVMNWGG